MNSQHCIRSMVFTLLIIFTLSIKTEAQQGGDETVVEGRSRLMRRIRDTFQPFRAMLMAGELEVLTIQSKELHGLAKKIPTAFTKRALTGESRAKTEIWDDRDGFTRKAKEFADAVAGIQQASRAGDAKKTESRIKSALAACKSCHRSFRKPKAKAEDEYQ